MIKKTLLYGFIPLFTLVLSAGAASDTLKKITALAKKPPLVLPNDPLQLDFVFDQPSDLKAQLRENGNFFLQGYLRHGQFRCGVYELGIQFGKGDGCVNVEWFSEPVFVSRERQCNQAVLHHKGAGDMPEIAGRFNEVTCAQLHIKCEGVCGLADMPKSNDSPSDGLR